MKRSVQDWSIEKLHRERTRISFPEYQRQDNLWSAEKKSLLIDSILQDIDIPKLYFFLSSKDSYEVVDGQQRLWAIWEFLDERYSYKSNGDSKKFSSLSAAQKTTIRNYTLQVTLIEKADDEYLRQLFLRLQLGLLLITGEKLHAAVGAMKELAFTKLPSLKFIKNVGIPSRRYAKETLCAQICVNSFAREKLKTFARTRYEDLLHFFKEYEYPRGKDLEFFQAKSKKITSVTDELWLAFGERTKQLKNRSYILSVYLFFEELRGDKESVSSDERKRFVDFVFKLWKRLREEISAGFDRKNKELYTFETYLSSAPGEKYQIERRHEKLREYYAFFIKTGKIKGD
ncbi:MAG TPA: DUF262 domain-containing protein [Pyrinomonadaceae bacterium]|jgi:hypothetical protein